MTIANKGNKPFNLKDLFPEGYNADDDSFEEEEMEQA